MQEGDNIRRGQCKEKGTVQEEKDGARRRGRCDGSCPLFQLFSEPGLAGSSQRAQTVLMSSHVC